MNTPAANAGEAPASCTTTAGQELLPREELLATMAMRAKELKKQYPSADLKLEEEWWVPSVDFAFMLKALPQETSARVNAIFAKLIQDRFAPESLTEGRQQLRDLLQLGHPEVMERFEEVFFVKHKAQFAEVHRQLQDISSVPGCTGRED